MKTPRLVIAAAVAVGIAALAGCATTSQGMGGGELSAKGKPDAPVLLSWKSNDGGISGTLYATLPKSTYTGKFRQITSQTETTDIEPMWVGWNQGWNDWPYWNDGGQGGTEVYDSVRFSRDYSGKVIANLTDDAGQHMRCRFHMNNPTGGMADGGRGECQLAGGKTVSAVINHN